ncbi:MAG TPA: ATP-binding protein [Gemmataceae bacterium]
MLVLFGRLLTEGDSPAAFQKALGETAAVFGLAAVGVRWPLEGPAKVLLVGGPAGPCDPLAETDPAAAADAVRGLREGEVTTVPSRSPGPGEAAEYLLAPVPLSGRPPGVVWLAGPPGRAWTGADRNLARFLGRLLGRSDYLGREEVTGIDQERLLRRLQDASVIAGRMAHEFDNILTGILGFTDLTLPLLPAGSQSQQFVTEVHKVGQRGILFTEQLHQLSRSGQVKPQPGSVAEALDREKERLAPRLTGGRRLEVRLPPDLPAVAMEAGPLQVVLGHVLANAVDALPENGTVTVTAERTELSRAEADGYLGAAGPGPAVAVSVTDTGPGVAPEVRARLFAEPFYTTKVRHRGLGLAIVYRVLHAHRAGIRIEPASPGPGGPAAGGGTTARLVFPVAPNKKNSG